MTSPSNFSLDHAVLLATAQVAYLAEKASIDALIIKGPGAVRLGVRPKRPSMDVDVFVRPRQTDEFALILRDLGWLPRPYDLSDVFPSHSLTLYHPNWPCDIDIHYRYPGMEKPPEIVFDALWQGRTEFFISKQKVRTPGLTGAVLIQALHSLRALWQVSNQADYEFLKLCNHLPTTEVLATLAEKTGSLGTCRPFLLVMDSNPLLMPPVDVSNEWEDRSAAEIPGLFRSRAIMRSPWRAKARLFMTAVYPSKQQLVSQNIHLADKSFIVYSKVRFLRIIYFLIKLPRFFVRYLLFRRREVR